MEMEEYAVSIISEFEGYKLILGSLVCWSKDGGKTYTTKLPDYFRDLNAVFEVEKLLDVDIDNPDSIRYAYARNLYNLVHKYKQPFRASAHDRATALFQTIITYGKI